MKQKKIILIVILVLAVAVAVLVILRLSDGRMVEQGQVEILCQDQKWSVGEADIAKVPVKGELVNGKGETILIDAKGSALTDVLASVGIDPARVAAVRITAQDEFSAEVSGEELRETGKVYLIGGGDGSVTLVVFGDSNSKRNVKNVARIEVDLQ